MQSVNFRFYPRPAILTKFIFLLALVLYGAEQAGVVIQTGESEADVYLDGNFVAKTNARGNLAMENLPLGMFRFTIRKNGCQPYYGSFQTTNGETKIIQARLRRMETLQSSTEALPPARERLPEEAVSPPEAPVAAAPEAPIAARDNWFFIILPATAALAALLLTGFWIARRRTHRISIESPPADPILLDRAPGGDPAPKIKPPPEFVDQLKLREELIQAGFVSIDTKGHRPVDRREQEVVIVLPKDAYTSKEE